MLRAHSDKKVYKTVKILGKDVTVMIDSGSDLHLVRSSFYVQLDTHPIRPKMVKFDGMGAIGRSTLARFTTNVIIDGLTFTLDVDVVPDHFMAYDFLIGGKLSSFAEIRIRKQKATLKSFE